MNICGQIVLENVYMTQGRKLGSWSTDNITEADVLEYYELQKNCRTTPQYGRV